MKVELNDISKRYGRVQANDGIRLNLEPGRIYGLLGENGAGKSTLMRILAGHSTPDSGQILFDGRPAGSLNPKLALEIGVGMLYQDPLDFPAMKVWENFQIGRPRRSRKEAVARLKDIEKNLDFELPPDDLVSELTVGERQQLEMLRLMDAGVKVLILDEPTTGISLPQKVKLFQTLKRLAEDPTRTIIVVTHKISDAVELCDRIFVMRQGKLAADFSPPFTSDRIVQAMFGAAAAREDVREGLSRPDTEVRLMVKDGRFVGDQFSLADVSLKVHAREIIGLAGLEGNGQQVLLKGLAGLLRMPAGRLEVSGRPLQRRPYPDYRSAGVHFLPAARMEQGLFPDLSLSDHICLAFPRERGRLREFYDRECAARFRLKADPSTCAKALSGGNQQRLLLSLIPADVKLLLMEHPTRGLDVGSAAQVWDHLKDRCRQGASLLFSSADIDELLEHSHRILVFYNRRIFADVPAEAANVETIGALMSGQKEAA